MVAGREDIITISITGKLIPCVLFLCWLPWNMHPDRSEHVYFLCVLTCAWKLPFACMFWALNAETLFTEAPIITMWDWLFDCFQGVSAKSLFCDYRLIICPPKRLSGAISRFHHPGLSGGWAFDWQLVNDVISILLGKWSSSDSRLVGEGARGGGLGNLLRLMLCRWWMAGRLLERGTARLSCLRRDWEEEESDEGVWQMSHCGQLFITCTRWLMGCHLITFADTCFAIWLPVPKSYTKERWPVVWRRIGSTRGNVEKDGNKGGQDRGDKSWINGSDWIDRRAQDEQFCT